MQNEEILMSSSRENEFGDKQARTYVDPRGLNMNCNVLDALGLNFRTDFVTCEDCPTCSTCLTWMTFLSVEKFSKSGAMAS